MKDKATLLKTLTPLQFHVTQDKGTEAPFTNPYDMHFEKGIYVDIVSKEVLFSSEDKYDSGCGWPSFSKPVTNLKEVADHELPYGRTEVRSIEADSHLGHVFQETQGLRYCINSAALEFIPYKEMAKKGYSEYLYLFNEKR